MAYAEDTDDMTVRVTVPMAKISKFNDIAEIQLQALWLLREADKMRKAYPTGKKWQENFDNCLKVVNKINEIMIRTRTEISDTMRKNMNEELSNFFPF